MLTLLHEITAIFQQLLIPVGKTVEIYSVSDWSKVSTLQHDSIEQVSLIILLLRLSSRIHLRNNSDNSFSFPSEC